MRELVERVSQINFARLNYILIPESQEERDRLRQSWAARKLGGPLSRAWRSLTRQGRVLVLVMVFVGFGGLDVGESSNHLLAVLLLGALVGSLVMRRFFPMDQVALEVDTAPRVSVGEELVVRVTLRNGGDRAHGGLQLERPFLSWDGAWLTPPLTAPGLEPHEALTLHTRARFVARGRHYLDPFFAAECVPMRLAMGPGVESVGTPLLVVPRVAPVRHLELGMAPRFQPGGVPLASKTGESSELYGLRPYRRGDRLRDLHARSWARTGKPVVREYQQEYFTRVGVFVDTDPEGTPERAFEAVVSLAAGVVFRLSRGEALIDLLVTGDTLHTLTVGRALGTFEQALDHLACSEPGPSFDTPRTLELLAPHLGRLSSVVLVLNRWDPPRQRLAEELVRRGVAVKSLVVGKGSSERRLRFVSVAQVEGDEGLSL